MLIEKLLDVKLVQMFTYTLILFSLACYVNQRRKTWTTSFSESLSKQVPGRQGNTQPHVIVQSLIHTQPQKMAFWSQDWVGLYRYYFRLCFL